MAGAVFPLVLGRLAGAVHVPGDAVPGHWLAGAGGHRRQDPARSDGISLRPAQRRTLDGWRHNRRPVEPEAAADGHPDAGGSGDRRAGGADHHGTGEPVAHLPVDGAAGGSAGAEHAGKVGDAGRPGGRAEVAGRSGTIQRRHARRPDHRPAHGRGPDRPVGHRRGAAAERIVLRCQRPPADHGPVDSSWTRSRNGSPCCATSARASS